MKTSLVSPNDFFDFNCPTNTVKVENIPEHVDPREVIILFRSLIGDIRCVQDTKGNPWGQLQVSFHNRDAAMKALCMNGYTVGGAALAVSPVLLHSHVHRPKSHRDERRNLYVLGLPFALTKTEFCAVFSRFGTVSHSVILATVDNSSRRRGFVVMSSHEEAKRALTALTRTQIKGHSIDVSWAVVQRSQGFLDGGDRAMLLDPRSAHVPGQHCERHVYSSNGSDTSSYTQSFNEPDSGPIRNNVLPTPSLVITKLPALIFPQVQDLHPLLCPFGSIEKLEIVQTPNSDTISAIVQYASAEVAQEVKNALHGQYYGAYQIEARFQPFTFVNPIQELDFNASLNTRNVYPVDSAYASRTRSPLLGSVRSLVDVGTMRQLNKYSVNDLVYNPGFTSSATPPFSFALTEANGSRPNSACSRWTTGSPQDQSFFGHFSPPHRMHFNANNVYQNFAA